MFIPACINNVGDHYAYAVVVPEFNFLKTIEDNGVLLNLAAFLLIGNKGQYKTLACCQVNVFATTAEETQQQQNQ